MAWYVEKPIDLSSPVALLNVFSATCKQLGILPESAEGVDVTTVLWHAFGKGVATEADLSILMINLTRQTPFAGLH